MVSDVVHIRSNASLIQALEDWLKDAKSGRMRAIAFAAVMDGDTVCEGWAGEVEYNTMLLFAGINVLRDGYFHERIEYTAGAQI